MPMKIIQRPRGSNMPPTCKAAGCTAFIPSALPFCQKHWSKVPAALRKIMLAHHFPAKKPFKKGAKIRKPAPRAPIQSPPSPEYLQAFQQAIEALAAAQASTIATALPAPSPANQEENS